MIKTCQIEPSEILVITFTRAAAGEMQERFLKLCNGEHPPVTFGTFHAVFYAILKETAVCGSGSILSEAEKKKLLKDIIKRNRYEISTNGDMLEEILSEIGRYQNLDLGCIPQMASGIQGAAEPAFVPQNMEPDLFWNIYRDFTETKEILRKIDFDDMALKCEALFQKRPDILGRYQKRYKYLLVDEFQDISPIQYRIVRMLAKPENNLFIVGDDDQSIYGFRGSKPDIMKNFPADFPEAKIITLPINYRSTPEIVEAASLVISRNKNRFSKDIKAWNDAGQAVKTEKFATSDMQDKALIQYLTDEKNAGNLSDCAIICRTGERFMVLS